MGMGEQKLRWKASEQKTDEAADHEVAVESVCKYVNIDPDEFREVAMKPDKVDQDAIAALTRACGGQKQKTVAVIRVLRALENLAPAP